MIDKAKIACDKSGNVIGNHFVDVNKMVRIGSVTEREIEDIKLPKLLQYSEYNKFEKVIEKAKIACEESGNIIDDHFAHVSEMVKIGSSASKVCQNKIDERS